MSFWCYGIKGEAQTQSTTMNGPKVHKNMWAFVCVHILLATWSVKRCLKNSNVSVLENVMRQAFQNWALGVCLADWRIPSRAPVCQQVFQILICAYERPARRRSVFWSFLNRTEQHHLLVPFPNEYEIRLSDVKRPVSGTEASLYFLRVYFLPEHLKWLSDWWDGP